MALDFLCEKPPRTFIKVRGGGKDETIILRNLYFLKIDFFSTINSCIKNLTFLFYQVKLFYSNLNKRRNIMEITELRKLAKTNPREAFLIAFKKNKRHPLLMEFPPSVIVKIFKSDLENEVANWIIQRIAGFSFKQSLEGLKSCKTRDEPWSYLLHRALREADTIEKFKQVVRVTNGYDEAFLKFKAEKLFKAYFTKAKTKRDFLQILSFIKWLNDNDEKFSSIAYGNAFKLWLKWERQVKEQLFNLAKNSSKDLLLIITRDKHGLKSMFGKQAMELLAEM